MRNIILRFSRAYLNYQSIKFLKFEFLTTLDTLTLHLVTAKCETSACHPDNPQNQIPCRVQELVLHALAAARFGGQVEKSLVVRIQCSI